MCVLKIMEWNINGRSNYDGAYTIPPFVAKKILEPAVDADIVILTEFVMADGWYHLKSALEGKYKVFTSPYVTGQNGILIAIKKNVKGLDVRSAQISADINSVEIEKPDFLQVEVKYNENSLTIIGVRIKDTTFEDKRKQFETLLKRVGEIGKDKMVIISGDFNHGAIKYEYKEEFDYKDNPREDYNYQMLRRKFKEIGFGVHTPEYGHYGKKFSWVMENPMIKIKEDHLIANKDAVCNVDYYWDFVMKGNGYGDLKAEDYKSGTAGLPDHAILMATIELSEKKD